MKRTTPRRTARNKAYIRHSSTALCASHTVAPNYSYTILVAPAHCFCTRCRSTLPATAKPPTTVRAPLGLLLRGLKTTAVAIRLHALIHAQPPSAQSCRFVCPVLCHELCARYSKGKRNLHTMRWQPISILSRTWDSHVRPTSMKLNCLHCFRYNIQLALQPYVCPPYSHSRAYAKSNRSRHSGRISLSKTRPPAADALLPVRPRLIQHCLHPACLATRDEWLPNADTCNASPRANLPRPLCGYS